jgi:tripartite-type tricarboxylate transporter receptor subunit TctC
MKKINPAFHAVLALISGVSLPHAADAQNYPTRPVRIVVPFPAGSGVDIMTRFFSAKLSEALGQQFAVDNRAGAAGNIGVELVARSAADGYTLVTAPSSSAIGQSLYKNLSFDLARDFEAVAMFASAPFMLVVHPSLPVRDVKQLIALATSRPGQLTYASTGSGSAPHLSAEMFKIQSRTDILHVPYKGTPPALTDLVGGQVDMLFASTVSILPQLKAKRVRALAIAGTKRSNILPDLATFSESGMPAYDAGTWFALLAPAHTPQDIVRRLNAAVVRVGQAADMRERIAAEGADPIGGSPEQTAAFIKSEITKWGKVIAASGVRAD